MRLQGQGFLSFLLAISILSSCGGGSGGSNSTVISTTDMSSSAIVSSQSSSSVSSLANITQCGLLNFKSDDIIAYKMPILYGRCPTGETKINIEVAGKAYSWPIVEGYFKGAVLLNQGSNEIKLNVNNKITSTKLIYEPSTNPKKVQMVYAIANGDDGHYVAGPGEPNDMESAKKRLILEGLMMQSATAEMIYKVTGKHDTFTFVEDENGQPIINTLQMPQTREFLHAQNGLDIYYSIAEELKTESQYMNKYMVTMGFAGYKDGKTLATAALGGGNLAIFGALHLHTCPENIDEISASFSNNTRINTNILTDDSAGRGTYWANCATGMGASLHELGHTFGFPHTDYGIMMRGFDLFNRLFMITEPDFPVAIMREEEFDAVWHPDSMEIFKYSPWVVLR